MKMIDAFLKILSGAIIVVLLVGCSNDTPENSQVAEFEPQVTPEPSPEPTPEPVPPAKEKLIADPIVEEAIRKSLNKKVAGPLKAGSAVVAALFFFS